MAAMEDVRVAYAPTPAQRQYLMRGLSQPGGKLPLFGPEGQSIDPRVVRGCLAKGWAMPWFQNPMKPDWLICRLTDSGRRVVGGALMSA